MQLQGVECASFRAAHAPALAIGLVPPATELFLARHSITRSSPDSLSLMSLQRARGHDAARQSRRTTCGRICAAGQLFGRCAGVCVAIRCAAPRACGARRAAGGGAGDAQVPRRVVCEAVAAVGLLLAGHLIGLALRTMRRGASVSGAAARPPRRAALPEQHNVQFLHSGFRARSQRRGAPSAAHCRRAAPLCTAARVSARRPSAAAARRGRRAGTNWCIPWSLPRDAAGSVRTLDASRLKLVPQLAALLAHRGGNHLHNQLAAHCGEKPALRPVSAPWQPPARVSHAPGERAKRG